MELFTNEGIRHTASGIGVPLFVNKATKLRKHLSFARVCIEVEQDAPLSPIIQVDIEDFGTIQIRVDYPCKPKHCSFCKKSGHTEKNCKNFWEEWRPVNKNQPDTSNEVPAVTTLAPQYDIT